MVLARLISDIYLHLMFLDEKGGLFDVFGVVLSEVGKFMAHPSKCVSPLGATFSCS